MAARTLNNFSLKKRSRESLAKRSGRAPSSFYPDIIKAFLESGNEAADVLGTDKKPLTLRQGLNQALKQMELQDKILVSLTKQDGEHVVSLSLRVKPRKKK